MGKLNLRSKKIKLLFLLSVLIPIVIFFFKTDFSEVWAALISINLKFGYILITTFLAYLVATISWYVCLEKHKNNLSIFQLFVVRQIGETVGLYNPTSIIGGDILKSELLNRYEIPQDSSLKSVIVSRITAILSQITLFSLAIAWILLFSSNKLDYSTPLYLFVILLFSCNISITYWLLYSKKKFNLTQPNNWKSKIIQSIKHQLNQTKYNISTHSNSFWMSYLFGGLHWIIGSLEFYLVLLFLGYDINVMYGLFLEMSVIVLKSFGAFVPGQIGVEEFSNKIALSTIGISRGAIWITVSILRRTRQLFWIAIGFILLAFLKKNPTYVAA